MALPALVINTPALEPLPRGRLLDMARPLVPHAPINGDQTLERWVGGGVTWTPEGCFALDTVDVDACARLDLNAVPRDCEPAVVQQPFSVYKVFKASNLEYTYDEATAIARDWVTHRFSAAVARELMTATVSGSTNSLSSKAHVARSQAGSAPVAQTLAKIEDDLAFNLRGNRGMIHLPPGMLGLAVKGYGLRLENGQWETPLGNLVVADSGYVNSTKPVGFGAAASATQDWIYGSGLVHFAVTSVGAVDGGNMGSTMTNFTGVETNTGPAPTFKSRNVMTIVAAAEAIVVFDPCPVVAALATYETEDDA